MKLSVIGFVALGIAVAVLMTSAMVSFVFWDWQWFWETWAGWRLLLVIGLAGSETARRR